MQNFVTRPELDLELQLERDLRRAMSQRMTDVERWFQEAGRRESAMKSEILSLRSMLRALMTDEHFAALDAEQRAGVTEVTEPGEPCRVDQVDDEIPY